MDELSVPVQEVVCCYFIVVIAFFAAVGYILWWIYDQLRNDYDRNKRNPFK